MRIRHLSTEELLLRCEAELGFERAAHLDECEACRTALVELVELLDDAEQELRGTVSADTAAERAAAWDAIEQRIGKPETVLAFPARWAAAYAVAAVLGFAVFSGITEMDLFGPSPVADPVTSAEATLPESPALEPAVPEPVQQERVSIESPAVAESEQTETVAAAPAMSATVIAEEKTFERYRAEPSVPESVPAVAVSFSEPPEIAAARSTMASLVLSSAVVAPRMPRHTRLMLRLPARKRRTEVHGGTRGPPPAPGREERLPLRREGRFPRLRHRRSGPPPRRALFGRRQIRQPAVSRSNAAPAQQGRRPPLR